MPRDAHLLVITAERTNPSALPDEDILSVYDVNQRQITANLLLRGPGLRLLGWVRMWRESSPELVATYNDCAECQRTTFFTTFHIDLKTHEWEVRWPRSAAGAPIFSEGQEANGGQQVYALLDDEAGRVVLGHGRTSARRAGRSPTLSTPIAWSITARTKPPSRWSARRRTHLSSGFAADRACSSVWPMGRTPRSAVPSASPARRHRSPPADVIGRTRFAESQASSAGWFSAHPCLLAVVACADQHAEQRYYAPLNSVAAFVEYSNSSSHIILGDDRQRKFAGLGAGLSAQDFRGPLDGMGL